MPLLAAAPLAARLLAALAVNALSAAYLKWGPPGAAPPGPLRVLRAVPVLAALLCVPQLVNNYEEVIITPLLIYKLCAPGIKGMPAHTHARMHAHTQVVLRASLMFSAAWLGTFKVFAMSLGRGPLLTEAGHVRPYVQLLAVLSLPIYPQEASDDGAKGRMGEASGGGNLGLLARGLAKMVLLGVLVTCVLELQLPAPIRNYALAFGMVGFLGVIQDLPASIALSFVGLKIIPTFDQPWLSSSLADFWGKRWNITTSSMLRTVVHDCIMSGQLVKQPAADAQQQQQQQQGGRGQQQQGKGAEGQNGQGLGQKEGSGGEALQGEGAKVQRGGGRGWLASREARRALGVMLTFLVSGIAHELIIRAMQEPGTVRGPYQWKWLAFFTIQGPLLLTEVGLKRWWGRRGLPPLNIWVARGLTTALLLSLAGPLFFHPAEVDTDIQVRMLKAMQAGYSSLVPYCQRALGAVKSYY